jgi:uncharacterized protein (TIGR02452 family)
MTWKNELETIFAKMVEDAMKTLVQITNETTLGAWGCGAFENDVQRTARDFRHALEGEFRGMFSQVVFAITDWFPKRRFLRPFRDVFMA